MSDSEGEETSTTADPVMVAETTDLTVSAAAAAKKKKQQAKKEKEKAAKEKEKEKDAKKKKKTPGDLIKELKKEQEAEEARLRKKQEDEEKRLEELETQRLQKLKEEQERKEREKQKKKEKIERLKKEGKFLTPDQKARQARQKELVEELKKQGILFGAEREKKDNVAIDENEVDTEKIDKIETPDEKETIAVEENEEKIDEIVDSWDLINMDDVENGKSSSLEPSPPLVDNAEQIDEKISDVSDDENNVAVDEQKAETNVEAAPKIKEKETVVERIKKRQQEAISRRSLDVLRSPVVCVLGHVDTGKTKILDKIRRTHVQDGEAGGITQQIGATMVPKSAIKDQTKMVDDFDPVKLAIPGFLIIDTPGHESFSNLRSRGSSLCDFAILVVDIMHGLEPQTIESLNMLKKRKTPFVIALNKIDRLNEWKPNPHKDVRTSLKSQHPNAKIHFDSRVNEIVVQFAEKGDNVALFWENKDPNEYFWMIPTSAHSGDGMGNLIAVMVDQAQTLYRERLAYCENLKCSVLEVKALPGLGTTIDVILVNGTLRRSDTILVAGLEGPIVAQIRELLMPPPLREMRVKNAYDHFEEIPAAQGVKILANGLEKALAGLPLFVAKHEDEIEHYKQELVEILDKTLRSIKLSEKGVYVQASTLGSLEALLEFLRTQKIPYSGINIGPVHRKDVMKASTMLEHDAQWAVILAFDVKIERDAQQMADELGVRIFSADIIYHLQDAFVKYREELKNKKRQEHAHLAIFPCKLRIIDLQHVFRDRDPMIVGVVVDEGVLKVGTPLCVPSKECITIGTVSSIEVNHKPMEIAKRGQEVCIKIENTTGDAPKAIGRHFEWQELMVSKITRESIDVCKEYFREDLQKNDWQLIVELKKTFSIL